MRIYSPDGKSVTLCGNGGGKGAKTGLYAIPSKTPVYEVKDGMITIKGKQYPIKLVDGFYIIRKLTVSECKRLQTVPDWYEFPVSDTQAYKMLGNGWTVDVICHLINSIYSEENNKGE
jgi:DNA (cytosine-5)-methyltransferase 3A